MWSPRSCGRHDVGASSLPGGGRGDGCGCDCGYGRGGDGARFTAPFQPWRRRSEPFFLSKGLQCYGKKISDAGVHRVGHVKNPILPLGRTPSADPAVLSCVAWHSRFSDRWKWWEWDGIQTGRASSPLGDVVCARRDQDVRAGRAATAAMYSTSAARISEGEPGRVVKWPPSMRRPTEHGTILRRLAALCQVIHTSSRLSRAWRDCVATRRTS
jgi:hypothetical protein